MKILITGGNGFIGKRLTKKLSGINEVFLLGNEESDIPNYIQKDIRDKDLDLSGYDVVFHLAAVSLPKTAEQDRELAWDVNVEGTRNIAKRMRKGQRLVFMSSAHIYDRSLDKVHTENEIACPDNFYGLTKLIGENIIRFYAKDIGFDYVVFRLFNSYSADQGPGLLVGDVIKKYREEETIRIFNPGFVLDMVHIDDVIDVLDKAGGLESGIYNICSGHEISIQEIYDKIKEHLEAQGKKEQVVSDKKGRMLGDNSKLINRGFNFRKFSL